MLSGRVEPFVEKTFCDTLAAVVRSRTRGRIVFCYIATGGICVDVNLGDFATDAGFADGDSFRAKALPNTKQNAELCGGFDGLGLESAVFERAPASKRRPRRSRRRTFASGAESLVRRSTSPF